MDPKFVRVDTENTPKPLSSTAPRRIGGITTMDDLLHIYGASRFGKHTTEDNKSTLDQLKVDFRQVKKNDRANLHLKKNGLDEVYKHMINEVSQMKLDRKAEAYVLQKSIIPEKKDLESGRLLNSLQELKTKINSNLSEIEWENESTLKLQMKIEDMTTEINQFKTRVRHTGDIGKTVEKHIDLVYRQCVIENETREDADREVHSLSRMAKVVARKQNQFMKYKEDFYQENEEDIQFALKDYLQFQNSIKQKIQERDELQQRINTLKGQIETKMHDSKGIRLLKQEYMVLKRVYDTFILKPDQRSHGKARSPPSQQVLETDQNWEAETAIEWDKGARELANNLLVSYHLLKDQVAALAYTYSHLSEEVKDASFLYESLLMECDALDDTKPEIIRLNANIFVENVAAGEEALETLKSASKNQTAPLDQAQILKNELDSQLTLSRQNCDKFEALKEEMENFKLYLFFFFTENLERFFNLLMSIQKVAKIPDSRLNQLGDEIQTTIVNTTSLIKFNNIFITDDNDGRHRSSWRKLGTFEKLPLSQTTPTEKAQTMASSHFFYDIRNKTKSELLNIFLQKFPTKRELSSLWLQAISKEKSILITFSNENYSNLLTKISAFIHKEPKIFFFELIEELKEHSLKADMNLRGLTQRVIDLQGELFNYIENRRMDLFNSFPEIFDLSTKLKERKALLIKLQGKQAAAFSVPGNTLPEYARRKNQELITRKLKEFEDYYGSPAYQPPSREPQPYKDFVEPKTKAEQDESGFYREQRDYLRRKLRGRSQDVVAEMKEKVEPRHILEVKKKGEDMAVLRTVIRTISNKKGKATEQGDQYKFERALTETTLDKQGSSTNLELASIKKDSRTIGGVWRTGNMNINKLASTVTNVEEELIAMRKSIHSPIDFVNTESPIYSQVMNRRLVRESANFTASATNILTPLRATRSTSNRERRHTKFLFPSTQQKSARDKINQSPVKFRPIMFFPQQIEQNKTPARERTKARLDNFLNSSPIFSTTLQEGGFSRMSLAQNQLAVLK